MKLLALVFDCIMFLPTVSPSCNSGRNRLLRQELFCNIQCSVRVKLKEIGGRSSTKQLDQNAFCLYWCSTGWYFSSGELSRGKKNQQLWYPASACNVITIKEGDGSSWRNKSKTSLGHHGNWPLTGTAGSGAWPFQNKNCFEWPSVCWVPGACLKPDGHRDHFRWSVCSTMHTASLSLEETGEREKIVGNA